MCKCNAIGITADGVNETTTLELPNFMKDHFKNSSGRTRAAVDSCMVDEIIELWGHGIITTGCCCGHNHHVPYIGVADQSVERMNDLGYKVQYNPCRPNDNDTFFPKKHYPYL